MAIKFKYTTSPTLDTKSRMTKRPMLKLEVVLANGNKIFPLALIDSGADQTMVNAAYAKELGIDLTKAVVRPMNGIVGAQDTLVAPFTLKFVDLHEELTVPACYIDSPNVNILIGEEGFFDEYRIKFEKDHDTFEISKRK